MRIALNELHVFTMANRRQYQITTVLSKNLPQDMLVQKSKHLHSMIRLRCASLSC